jgi:hypothetical protein
MGSWTTGQAVTLFQGVTSNQSECSHVEYCWTTHEPETDAVVSTNKKQRLKCLKKGIS